MVDWKRNPGQPDCDIKLSFVVLGGGVFLASSEGELLRESTVP